MVMLRLMTHCSPLGVLLSILFAMVVACGVGTSRVQIDEVDTEVEVSEGHEEHFHASSCRLATCKSATSTSSGNSEADELLCCPLVTCPAQLSNDPVDVKQIQFDGDILVVSVQFTGGCASHTFELCWRERFLESLPVQAKLHLDHNANGDGCETPITEELRFDVSSLRTKLRFFYGRVPQELIIRLQERKLRIHL